MWLTAVSCLSSKRVILSRIRQILWRTVVSYTVNGTFFKVVAFHYLPLTVKVSNSVTVQIYVQYSPHVLAYSRLRCRDICPPTMYVLQHACCRISAIRRNTPQLMLNLLPRMVRIISFNISRRYVYW